MPALHWVKPSEDERARQLGAAFSCKTHGADALRVVCPVCWFEDYELAVLERIAALRALAFVEHLGLPGLGRLGVAEPRPTAVDETADLRELLNGVRAAAETTETI